jgi:hypothetical protein
VDRAWGFNLSSLLFDNLRVRFNAAATMERAGHWTAHQNEHVAEATLAASEDPIAGSDQKSEDYQLKMWKEFAGRDPQPIACGSSSTDLADMSKTYRKRSIAAVFKQNKLICKEVQRFQVAVMFIDSCNPTGNCTDDELLCHSSPQGYDERYWLGLHEERHAALGLGVSFGLQGAEDEPEVARC